MGDLIEIAAMTDYTFQMVASTSTYIILGNRCYLSKDYVSGMLLVRVKAKFLQALANIKIGLAPVLVMPDDPQSVYAPDSSDPLSNFVEMSILAADTITAPGRLYPKEFSGKIPAMFRCYLSVNQNVNAGLDTISCGVAVVMRNS